LELEFARCLNSGKPACFIRGERCGEMNWGGLIAEK